MPQSFDLPVGTDRLNVAIKTKIANSLEALRTLHSGTTEPSSTAADMLWMDTSATPPVLKVRDGSNASWINLTSIESAPTRRLGGALIASLSSTSLVWLGPVTYASTAVRLIMFGETASSSSSGNEWQFQLKKYPHAAPGSPVDLISGTVGTFTALAGVGGSEEFVADKVMTLTPDQNLTMTDKDLLELVVTKAGTATTLTNFHAYLEII